MAFITKEHALKIATKLDAKIETRPGRGHDLACIYEAGRLIAQFGIRRGSRKDLGHDFIPSSLYIRPRDAKDIAICRLYRDWYIQTLSKKGMV